MGFERCEMGNSAEYTVRQTAGSVLFLTAAIVYSSALVLKLLIAMQGTGGWMSYINRLLYQSDMGYYMDSNPYIQSFQTGSAVGTVIGMLPSIALAVGVWLIYAAAVHKQNVTMSTTGLEVIRIVSIVSIVISSIAAVFLVFVFCGLLLAYNAVPTGVVVCIVIGIVVVFAIVIVYDLKIIKSVNSVKYAILGRESSGEVSMFVAVVVFISGGFTAISALSSLLLGSFLVFLNNGCAAAANILFGIILISYRNKIRQIPSPGNYMQNKANAGIIQGNADETGILVNGNLDNGTVVLSNPLQQQKMGVLTRVKTREEIHISGQSFWIGKDRANVNYCISDNSAISRRHAQLVYHDGNYFIRDFNSTNHVYINKNLIAANTEVRISSGDIINLADEEFVFSLK